MWPFPKKKKTEALPDFSSRIAHVAFIMDGNGRWARRRGLPREAGHISGAENFRRVMDSCKKMGIKTVTVYAFSTENWSRPKKEVDGIMRLLEAFLDEELVKLAERDTQVVFLGDKAPLPPALREKAEEIERKSVGSTFRVNVALNYGGRDEILHAVNTLLAAGRPSVSEAEFEAALYTAGSPAPDLVIRTGGDYRISNFLLWQSAYAEYYFTKTLWPDLGEAELCRAFEDFCGRQRRFGGVIPDEKGSAEA